LLNATEITQQIVLKSLYVDLRSGRVQAPASHARVDVLAKPAPVRGVVQLLVLEKWVGRVHPVTKQRTEGWGIIIGSVLAR